MSKYHNRSRRSLLALWIALGVLPGCAAGSGGQPPGDDTTTIDEIDGHGRIGDSAIPVPDGGSDPIADAATPPPDSGTPPVDPPDAGTPDPASPDSGPGPGPSTTPYPLPPLPAGLTIAWPAPPVITRTVTVHTLDEANAAAAVSGTRVHVEGSIPGTIRVGANDVDLEFAPGASTDVIMIGRALARVSVHGGSVEHFEVELAATWSGDLIFDRALMTTDLLIDGVEAHAADTAFLLRAGIRLAIVNCRGTAGRYSVWMGDSGSFESEDVIAAGNEFSSAGPESTFRLVHVVRSVTVDNRFENGLKHNYRIHGRSRDNFASGNLLVNSGIMLGTMATDSIGRQWFVGNEIHNTTPSLLEIHTDTPSVTIRDNTIYSNVWSCLLCRDTPPGWVIENNTMLPYAPPPR